MGSESRSLTKSIESTRSTSEVSTPFVPSPNSSIEFELHMDDIDDTIEENNGTEASEGEDSKKT